MRTLYKSFWQKSLGIKDKITISPLNSLSIIFSKQLSLNSTHINTYLKLKIDDIQIGNKFFMSCQDHLGDKIKVQLEHHTNFFLKKLNVGKQFYLKQPFLNDQNIVQVDVKTDIQFEEANISSQSYLKQAIKLENAGKGFEAYCLYASALNNITNLTEAVPILIQKAQMCLKLNLKEQYRENIVTALSIDSNNQQAHYHLIKYDAIRTNNINKEKFEKIRQRIKENAILKQSLKQQLYKLVDFHESFQTNNKINWYNAILNRELGEFFSPKVKIGQSQFGKGIFATQDIREGQIIAIELPFIKAQFPKKQSQICSKNIKYCTEFFINSRQIRNKLYNLHLSMNKSKQIGLTEIVQQDIRNLLQTYSFGNRGFRLQSIYQKAVPEYDISAFYEKCSYFNHSCDSKTHMFFFAEHMFIYTIQDIKASEEIFISYVGGQYSQRTERLLNWNIQCNCSLCIVERKMMDEETNEGYKFGSKGMRYKFLLNVIQSQNGSLEKLISKVENIEGFIGAPIIELVDVMYEEPRFTSIGDEVLRKIFPMSLKEVRKLREQLLSKDTKISAWI